MRVITFSRYFPAYHPRKGEPTYFIEKIWAGLADSTDRMQGAVDMDFYEYYNGVPKWHTIRSGNRWKVGDYFSPRYWSGKPYASKQELITEPLQIKKIWNIKIEKKDGILFTFFINGENVKHEQMEKLSRNDGLKYEDMVHWFDVHPKMKDNIIEGQILCWNENINY